MTGTIICSVNEAMVSLGGQGRGFSCVDMETEEGTEIRRDSESKYPPLKGENCEKDSVLVGKKVGNSYYCSPALSLSSESEDNNEDGDSASSPNTGNFLSGASNTISSLVNMISQFIPGLLGS